MLNRLMYGVFGIVVLTLISCSPKQSELIVAEYGDYEITMSEFEKAYTKNLGSYEKAKKDSIENLKKFLDLYVNYKMKLRDADIRKLNTNPAILKELNDYEKTIGASYIIEKELFDKGLHDLYEKRKEELRLSHLLIRTDTLTDEEAKKKAYEIVERIKNGSSFEDEVKLYTDDQFSKDKGGDIYYITAGTVMPEFEDLAYNTPTGSVNPEPLKTKYGYHIIKVTERKTRVPKIQASHILIRKQQPDDKKEGKFGLDLAKDLVERIKNGEDFGKLAVEYSEDPGSKQKNGDLGFFGRRQMVQPFDKAAFNLEIGEVSDIVESKFGYHIIKVTDKLAYPSFEEESKTIREIYERSRRKIDYDALINKYSNEAKLVMHDEVFKNVVSNLQNVDIHQNYWESDFQSNFGNSVLFTIGDVQYTTDSLFAYALLDSKMSGRTANEKILSELLTNCKNNKVLQTKAQSLVKEDPEFAELMKEYKNGIFIFKLQEDEVWNKMKMDSIAIKKLYEATKKSYIWPDRVKFTEIFTKSDSLAKIYHRNLLSGANFDTLYAKYHEKAKSKNSFKNTFVEVSTNALAKAAYGIKNEGGFSDVIKNGNGWSIIRLIKKDPSRIKIFEEARAEVTSAYQDIESSQLENTYVARLKDTYNPKLFYEELENAYKN